MEDFIALINNECNEEPYVVIRNSLNVSEVNNMQFYFTISIHSVSLQHLGLPGIVKLQNVIDT
jgi:hypothetical protein